jgi:hypothetical protein
MQDNVHHHLVLMLMAKQRTRIKIFPPERTLTLRKSCTIPKSQSLRIPSFVIKIFSGLTYNKNSKLRRIFDLLTYIHMNII